MSEEKRDPRDILAREKLFTLRPRPLEQWLWKARLPASAQRVFWLHWQESMRTGWCSSIPLKRVAKLCLLDISTVSRAYQVLCKLGLLRREDPGRDPSKPFEQAVAITEIRIPQELTKELPRHPNRGPAKAGGAKASPESQMALPPLAPDSSEKPTSTVASADPFPGMGGRERMRALAALREQLSPAERGRYDEAVKAALPTMRFDNETLVSPDQQALILRILRQLASAPALPATQTVPDAAQVRPPTRRTLSLFEAARLRQGIQQTIGNGKDSAELLRQVVWSIEHGALRRFERQHAIAIALKKIRERAWTRPHRMPPNWYRELLSEDPAPPLLNSAAPEYRRSA